MKTIAMTLLGGALALSLASPALAEPVVLEATLAGANETGGGDPDGSGSFSVEIDAESGDVCYVLTAADIGAATAAHVHEGAAGKDGKPVLTLQVTGEDEDVCLAAEPETLAPIVAAPADYYVNVHSAAFPKGAIRGQLSASGGEGGDDMGDM